MGFFLFGLVGGSSAFINWSKENLRAMALVGWCAVLLASAFINWSKDKGDGLSWLVRGAHPTQKRRNPVF